MIREILEERRRQDHRWGKQTHPPFLWAAILSEETGEVAKAALEDSWENYRRELVQIAAVAVAALEALDILMDSAMGLSCEDCGLSYQDFGLDSTLPNDQWAMIHPTGGGGILCTNCMVNRASRLDGAVAVRMHIEFSGEEER